MKRVIVIPARIASTRLPKKPLQKIGGKPLVQWVHEKAMRAQRVDSVLIATDDAKIREAALTFGAEVIMTEVSIASGTDRVYHAIKDRKADIIVNLQCDEPMIRPDMIDTLFAAIENERLDMATLCTPLTQKSEYTDPNTVKVVIDKYGFALYFSRSPIPYQRRKRGALLYKHIGIYGFSRGFLEKFVSLEKGVLEETESLEQLRALENGYRIKVLPTEYDGFGIDTEEDLKKARRVLLDSRSSRRGR